MIAWILLFWDVSAASCFLTIACRRTLYLTGAIPLFPWLLATFLVYGFFSWFFRKERSANAAAALVIVAYLLYAAGLVLPFYPITTPASPFAPLLCLAFPFSNAVRCSSTPPTANRLTPRFEGSFALIGLALLFDAASQLGGTWVLHIVAAALLCVLAMAVTRLAGHDTVNANPIGATVAVAGCVGLFSLVGLGTFLLLRTPYEKGVSSLLSLIFRAASFVAGLINAFLFWLVSLLPTDEGTTLFEPAGVSVENLVKAAEEPTPVDPLVVALVAGLAVLLLLGALFWGLKGMRIKKRARIRANGRLKRNGPGLWKACLLTLTSLLTSLRIRLRLAAMRGTVLWLYYSLQADCARTSHAIRPGETPSAFLNRLGASFSNREALAALADQTNAVLYGQMYNSRVPGAAALRKAIKKELRANRFSKPIQSKEYPHV